MRVENGLTQGPFEGMADVSFECPKSGLIEGLIVKIQEWGYQSYQEEIEKIKGRSGLLVAQVSHYERRLDQYFGFCRVLIPRRQGEDFTLPVRLCLRGKRIDFGVREGLVGLRVAPHAGRGHRISLTRDNAAWVSDSFVDLLARNLVLKVTLQQQGTQKEWHTFPVTASLNSILEDQ